MQWGAWGGGGMAVQVAGFMERMARMGLGVLPPPRGLAALARALKMAWSPCLTQGPPVTIGAPPAACPRAPALCLAGTEPFHSRKVTSLQNIMWRPSLGYY